MRCFQRRSANCARSCATAALACVQDAAFPDPLRDQRQRVVGMPQQRQHAHEARAAFGIGHPVELAQQLADIRLAVAMGAGIARRIQPRRAVQRVHAQAGIVRQRRQAGGARGMACFQDRVLDERGASLFGIGESEFGLRMQREAGTQQLPQLHQLAGVAAGQHQPHACASASRWAANSALQPCSARVSRASSSSRRKAWPSAVPCSSMKPPPSFITTFMSVSQALSSA